MSSMNRFAASRAILRGFSTKPGAAALVVGALLFFSFGITAGFALPVLLVADFFGLLSGGVTGWLENFFHKTRAAGEAAGAPVSPQTILTKGDAPQATPAWLTKITGAFDVEMIQRENTKSSGVVSWVIAAQDPRDPLAVGRVYDAFTSSCDWERLRRGYPIRDDAGALLALRWLDDGIVIEETEQDDGSVIGIVATGVTGCVSESDYAKAEEVGLCGHYVHWSGEVAGTSRYVGDKPKVTRGLSKDLAVQPLYTLQLERRTMRAAVSNSNPFAPPSTVHGDAAFAWWDDLNQSRATTAFWGDEGERDPAGAIMGEFVPSRFFPGQNGAAIIQATGEGHSLTVGAPGTGKFTAGIAPMLLTADAASFVVFDVKNGEATRKTGRHRAKLGRVLVLDPFGVSGQPSGALNPLDGLREDDPMLVEKVRKLVEAIYLPTATGGEDNSFWDSAAKSLLSAFILHAATAPQEEGQRTLKRVREMIQTPLTAQDNDRANALLSAMSKNEAGGGLVRDEAENFLAGIESKADKTLYSVQQTLKAQTDFLGLGVVQKVTETTTLDPAILRQEIATLYVVVPESELKTVSRWLRLVYNAIMSGVRSEGVPLHVVMDEFPALGSFPRVVEDMARVRSLGIRMHVIVQSLAQLQQIYGRGWETFTANARYLKVLGANDDMTQRHVSGRLGKTTVRTRSDSTNRQHSGGGGAGSSFSFQGVPLMTPDQVGRLNADELLVIVEGEKPLRLSKLHAYKDPGLKALGDF